MTFYVSPGVSITEFDDGTPRDIVRSDMIKIGFIGQGWVGKPYANDFETRGFDVVRYALEEPYCDNKEKLSGCEIVFICVPTPTVNGKVDTSIVKEALMMLDDGTIAVIKSTIPPGTTGMFASMFPDLYVYHSPEFLREKTAQEDASRPYRNILGTPYNDTTNNWVANHVLDILPPAQVELITSSVNAELIKYAGNAFLTTKVVFANLLYDLTEKVGGNWEEVHQAWTADHRIGESHTQPWSDGGRGAGGDCFIKDFEAFVSLYREVGDIRGNLMLTAIKQKNLDLLLNSGKDKKIVDQVYQPEKVLDITETIS